MPVGVIPTNLYGPNDKFDMQSTRVRRSRLKELAALIGEIAEYEGTFRWETVDCYGANWS